MDRLRWPLRKPQLPSVPFSEVYNWKACLMTHHMISFLEVLRQLLEGQRETYSHKIQVLSFETSNLLP